MASWLRAAEGFLEVVDRTAKQVVREQDSVAPPPDASGSTQASSKDRMTHQSSAMPKIQLGDGTSSRSSGNGVYTPRDTADSGAKEQTGRPHGELVNSATLTEDESVSCRMTLEDDLVSVNLSVQNSGADMSTERSALDDQLEETNGLLRAVSTSGKSKEARLVKICGGLSQRVQELKAENAQLEELLQQERKLRKSVDVTIHELQEELAIARAATNAAESEFAAALLSKNAETEAVVTKLESANRRAQAAEHKLESIQGDMESVLKNREITETGMIQSLRQELASAEHRVEEERALHNATRLAAVQRETELEQRMAESTAALTKMQRVVEERSQKAVDLEQKVSMLEIECATLNQELQSLEQRMKREQKRQPEENLQAWREEAERARLSQRESEMKLSALEAEYQKLRVELASARQNTDLSTAQAHMELEKRFRELTELLYLKQTQLEAMASEKAAALLQLEKESTRLREAKTELERSRRQFSSMGDDDEANLRSFDSFGLQQRRGNPGIQRIVGPSIQTAAKFLDSGAVTAGRYLWRRPLARIFVLFYLVRSYTSAGIVLLTPALSSCQLFVHLFLMYLLHRLQEQTVSSMEAALKNGP